MKNEQEIKVLMYHGIVHKKSQLPDDRETGAELYDLPAEEFEKQMAHLKEKGYRVQKIDHAENHNKNVVITFDDGELNNFETALPILKKFNFPAYFFIIAGRVGKHGYMTWEQIRSLHDAGMVIGSHGLSHQILTNLMDSQIEEELRASKRTIELNINVPVNTISIPRGFCNEALIQKAHSLGYKTIFISDRPRDLQSKCFSRIAIKDSWNIKRFDRALEDKMTWIEAIFFVSKKSLKMVLRESWYNHVRSLLIKIIK